MKTLRLAVPLVLAAFILTCQGDQTTPVSPDGAGIRAAPGGVPGPKRDASDLVWPTLAAMPTAVRAAAAATDGKLIYVLGGNTGFANSTTLNQIYDPKTDTWTAGASFAAPARDFPMAATLSDGIHLMGGAPGPLTDHQVYNPRTNTWSPRAPLPEADNAAITRTVGGKIYYIKGADGKVFIYDRKTDSWSAGTAMPTVRGSAASAVIGRKIYVAGGQTAGFGTSDALEMYDPKADTWTALAPMPETREALGGGAIAGLFCVFGGRLANASPTGDAFPDTFCYDPGTNTWSSGPDMVTPRVEIASVELRRNLYAIGGRTIAAFANATNESLAR